MNNMVILVFVGVLDLKFERDILMQCVKVMIWNRDDFRDPPNTYLFKNRLGNTTYISLLCWRQGDLVVLFLF